ncbi:MAG: XdhC family protein [Bacteroidetes bacterium]|nr:XdhC family protein [Bacteroidota bacterium]
MKEIKTIIQAYHSIDFSCTKAALATVVRVEGSSYRRSGARMLVLDDGTYLGGISGGCLEGDALRRAQKAIGLGQASVVTYDTTQDDDYQIGVGLGCQGIIDVLFTPLRSEDGGNPVLVLERLVGVREPVAVVTVTGGESLGRTVVWGDGGLPAGLSGDVEACLEARASRAVVHGELKVFIEVLLPAIHVVAYGGNYDIRTLLNQVKELGWESTVVLNTARAERSLVAAATVVMDSREPGLPGIDGYTAVLLMSHDYKTDLVNLRKVLPSAASYIGMLGPRKRAVKMFEEMGLGEEEIKRVYAPAGLDIGAATPEEIALSILAEVRGHFASRSGASLRLREGTIY